MDFLPEGIQTLKGEVTIGRLSITEPITVLAIGKGIFDVSQAYSFIRVYPKLNLIYPPLE